MSFSGKKYKKVKVENVIELLEDYKFESKVLSNLGDSSGVISYTRNTNGTMRYMSVSGDEVKLDQTIVLNKESEYITPEGVKIKVIFTLDGDVLTNKLTYPDGKVIKHVRDFSGNGMKLTITIEGSGKPPGIVYFDSV